MSAYICTRCGGGQTEVSKAHPSLDDRYVVGYCIRCTPVPAKRPEHEKPAVRNTVPLCRADLWDPSVVTDRYQAEQRQKLLKRAFDPAAKERSSEAEVERATQILDEQFAQAEARHER